MKRDTSAVAAHLGAEYQVFRDFLRLLQQEQAALVEGKTDDLPQLAAHKSPLISQLGTFAAERQRALAAAGCDNTAAGMTQWLDAVGADVETRRTWNELLELAREAERINRANGALIETQLRNNQQALAVLRAAANPGSIYGPSGQISTPTAGASRDQA